MLAPSSLLIPVTGLSSYPHVNEWDHIEHVLKCQAWLVAKKMLKSYLRLWYCIFNICVRQRCRKQIWSVVAMLCRKTRREKNYSRFQFRSKLRYPWVVSLMWFSTRLQTSWRRRERVVSWVVSGVELSVELSCQAWSNRADLLQIWVVSQAESSAKVESREIIHEILGHILHTKKNSPSIHYVSCMHFVPISLCLILQQVLTHFRLRGW